MKKRLVILILLFIALKANSQCSYINNTFEPGEYATYKVYYNWGFIWLNAAQVYFKASKVKNQWGNAIKLTSQGGTLPNYDWIYKVRDKFESVIDPVSVKPYSFHRQTNEGGYQVNNRYVFQYPEIEIFTSTQNSETPLKLDTLKTNSCTYDVLSAIYACRTIDFSKKNINDTIPLNVIVDGEIHQLNILYLGAEKIVNKDKRSFNCNKFSVKMIAGTIFKGDKEMNVWVTADKNQVPVYIEAHILVGTIKAFIHEIKGTKWPANY